MKTLSKHIVFGQDNPQTTPRTVLTILSKLQLKLLVTEPVYGLVVVGLWSSVIIILTLLLQNHVSSISLLKMGGSKYNDTHS